MNHFDLVIIGGGSAAFSAALKADNLGKTSLIINEGLPIGGTCVNVGCVPSKFLIRASESIRHGSASPFAGVDFRNPEIDYSKIIQEKKKLVETMREKKYINVVKDLENVKIVSGRAEFVDNRSVRVGGGQEYTSDKIIIATGAATSIPQIKGLSEVPYLTNTTLFETEELPESLIVFGGGYIALEISQAYHRFGSDVTVLQRSGHVLSKQTKDVAEELTGHLTSEGVKIHTGIKLERVEEKDGKIFVFAKENGKSAVFESTHILVSTGTRPNTQNLGLEKIGVELLPDGHIKVSDSLQTAIPNVYAAGDCINTPAYVYTAAYEGSLASENALNGQDKTIDYKGLPWVIFTDPQVAGVGIDEKEAEEKNIPFEVSLLQLSEVPRSIAALDTRGFIKLIRNPETDLLLGTRIIAPEGGELAMEVSLAIKYGITVKELVSTFHPYLTLSEGIKLAAITFGKDVKKLSCCAG